MPHITIVARFGGLRASRDWLEASLVLTATAATPWRLVDAVLAVPLAPVDARDMEVAE